MEFDHATRIEPVEPGRWRGEVVQGWDMGGHPNGGYLMAIGLRAMLAAVPQPDPLTITAHFLAPATHGAVEVEVEPVRVGRQHATVLALVSQREQPVARLLGTFTDLADREGPAHVSAEAPLPPDPDGALPTRASPAFSPPPITERIELRLDPASAGFAIGRPGGRAEMCGWARFADGRPPDAASLAMFADAFPPAVFNTGLPLAWVPTLELTVHVRRRPAPGWLRARFVSRYVFGGYLEEDGEIWDSAGHLVALSRQLALVPRGEPLVQRESGRTT